MISGLILDDAVGPNSFTETMASDITNNQWLKRCVVVHEEK